MWRKDLVFIAATTLAVDLGSKWFAILWLNDMGGSIPALPIFSFTLVYNPGISFGLFGASTATQVWALSAIQMAIIAIVYWLIERSTDWWEQVGYACIVGGAFGNVTDRLHDGFVTDFLDFHLGGWRYPTFNLADCAITIGVGLILVRSLMTPAIRPAA